jgi:hypothetical protein
MVGIAVWNAEMISWRYFDFYHSFLLGAVVGPPICRQRGNLD